MNIYLCRAWCRWKARATYGTGGAINIYMMACAGTELVSARFFRSKLKKEVLQMLWMEDNEINGEALAALWEACFDRADAFTLCRAVWTHATNDALRKELEPYRVRSFHTARWFCHMSISAFPATAICIRWRISAFSARAACSLVR